MNRDATTSTLGDVKIGPSPLFGSYGIDTQGKTDIDYLIDFYALNGSWVEEMHYRRINGNLEHANRVIHHDFPANFDTSKVKDTVVFYEVSKNYPLTNGEVGWILPISQKK